MRISGNEPSSVILSQTMCIQQIENVNVWQNNFYVYTNSRKYVGFLGQWTFITKLF